MKTNSERAALRAALDLEEIAKKLRESDSEARLPKMATQTLPEPQNPVKGPESGKDGALQAAKAIYREELGLTICGIADIIRKHCVSRPTCTFGTQLQQVADAIMTEYAFNELSPILKLSVYNRILAVLEKHCVGRDDWDKMHQSRNDLCNKEMVGNDPVGKYFAESDGMTWKDAARLLHEKVKRLDDAFIKLKSAIYQINL